MGQTEGVKATADIFQWRTARFWQQPEDGRALVQACPRLPIDAGGETELLHKRGSPEV
jgi:hypothetical protein